MDYQNRLNLIHICYLYLFTYLCTLCCRYDMNMPSSIRIGYPDVKMNYPPQKHLKVVRWTAKRTADRRA